MSVTPDLDRDVIVQHVKGDALGAERWLVLVGSRPRAELPTVQAARVFARLLADLQQRPAWLTHASGDEPVPLEHGALRGCSCC